MKIGSLCSGYGGLDMAIQAAIGGELAWVSDYEPPTEKEPNPPQSAAKVLAHRYDVPNLGDMTAIDWSQVPRVDVLGGGTPCQDVSHAGRRAGMRAGTRSGLWASFADAIDVLRPWLVVWENVRGVLSAGADSGVEPCPLCVGDGSGPALRALGRVLGDLADLGYDARWCGLPASAVGAPHKRFRVFVVAYPAGFGPEGPWSGAAGLRAGSAYGGDVAAHADDLGRSVQRAGGWGAEQPAAAGDRAPVADADRDAVRVESVAFAGRGGTAVAGRGGPAAANAQDGRWNEGRPEPARQLGGPDAPERGGAAPADPDRVGQAQLGDGQPDSADPDGRGGQDTAWGAYEPAVRRWERVLGRPAPAPRQLNSKGTGEQLAPRFSEWMMGLPEGWVTDVPGLTRNEQLHVLGNGVVPQQGAAAIRYLLEGIS